MSANKILKSSGATTETALSLFDSLEPIDTHFMMGSWTGEGYKTGHRLDGLLEAYHWHGKRFENEENVHPLIFRTLFGGLACVNPVFLGPSLKISQKISMPKSAFVGKIFQFLMPPICTRNSRARLRMTTYRGKPSATMIYDQLPINDVFRKISDDSVLGVMDFKGMEKPFFFILHRESA